MGKWRGDNKNRHKIEKFAKTKNLGRKIRTTRPYFMQNMQRSYRIMINSMTEEEIADPEIILKQRDRLTRISRGCGLDKKMLVENIKSFLHAKEKIAELYRIQRKPVGKELKFTDIIQDLT